ncbi:MAG TPA: M48 family metalloprotease [Tissierellaceae bacterium]
MVALVNDSLGTLIITIFIDGMLAFLMWLWTKIGTVLVMYSRRQNEYLADEFAFKLGYGYSLCSVLDTFYGAGRKGLWANLVSSHPSTDDRIARLQSLGVDYVG